MTVKAVIFDFGGVFTISPVVHFAEYEREHNLPENFIGKVIKARMEDGAFARYERGECALDTFDVDFAAETKEAGHEMSGRTLMSLLQMTIRPEMVEAYLTLVEAGVRTGCITNNMPDSGASDWVRGEDTGPVIAQVFGHFEHVIESAQVGVRKPEPEIYQMMCDALGLAPEDCAFIDDLGVNLKPARDMGMKTIKAPLGDMRPAIEELSRLTGVAL
ncbi:MAG: HAD-IA family hydrolase [Pikeienuella sp.]